MKPQMQVMACAAYVAAGWGSTSVCLLDHVDACHLTCSLLKPWQRLSAAQVVSCGA